MQTKARILNEGKVQLKGNYSNFGSFYKSSWTPGRTLPQIEEGKEIVILHPCDCGCWDAKKQQSAMDLILSAEKPEQFVLFKDDPRYFITKDNTDWYIVER